MGTPATFPRKQDSDGVIGDRGLANREVVSGPWCKTQLPLDHWNYLLLAGYQQIMQA